MFAAPSASLLLTAIPHDADTHPSIAHRIKQNIRKGGGGGAALLFGIRSPRPRNALSVWAPTCADYFLPQGIRCACFRAAVPARLTVPWHVPHAFRQPCIPTLRPHPHDLLAAVPTTTTHICRVRIVVTPPPPPPPLCFPRSLSIVQAISLADLQRGFST